MNPIKFHTISELSAQFPGRFIPPSSTELQGLVPGMCVKVGVGEHGKGSEAFWVELTGIEQGQLKGIIVNHLSHTDIHGLKAGEQVAFGAACVIAITD